MSEFLGSRISLISKSDIRYVGVLHQINSDESTVSLENVRCFGTESRRTRPEEQFPPSDEVYEHIIFRGSDVKDLRIEDAPGIKENQPAMPEDPAIVGARARPGAGPPNQPQPGPAGFGQHPMPPNQNNFYPPPGPWGHPGGRGAPGPGPFPGPGPGPAGNMPYPPPPGWFPPGPPGPPGQNFPGPPGQWTANNFTFPPGQPMPPGSGSEKSSQPGAPAGPGAQDPKIPTSNPPQQPLQQSTPTPQAGVARPRSIPQQQQPAAPVPPTESKPSTEEVKATAATLDSVPQNNIPTGPRNNRVTPVVPLTGPKPQMPQAADGSTAQVAVKTAAPASNANIRDATQAAKAAVAVAMANLNTGGNGVQQPQPQSQSQPQPQPQAAGNGPMDNLTKRVDEMRINAARGGQAGQAGRGRGRGGRHNQAKVEVPASDFDFAGSNAKFNKGDLLKEAIAGSPLTDSPADATAVESPAEAHDGHPPVAYNKSSSFFDNISSEAKERAASGGQKAGGREWRGEEHRKNMETFGQGSVDGGYRGYRGRGRGRGRGYGRGRGGGYRGRGVQNGSSVAHN